VSKGKTVGPYYKAAGEKMLEAKPQMNHGAFGSWLRRNFQLGHSQAARYMKLAKTNATANGDISRAREFSSMNQFLRATGDGGYMPNRPRPAAWHDGVKESIERARRDAERLSNRRYTN
jgi:hypothetical protein